MPLASNLSHDWLEDFALYLS